MLNTEKGWRGGERQTLLCLEELLRAGHEVALVARRDEALARAAQAADIPVFAVDGPAALCRVLWRQRQRFDVMHAQTAATMTWLALLRPWLRARIVFTRRTAFGVTRRARLTAWKWRRADALVAISEAAAQEPRRLGLDVSAIIPSAVPFVPVNEAALVALQERHAQMNGYIVATSAALTQEKDPLTLIRAVHALRQQRDDFVFLHFGAEGDMAPAARAEVARLGLEAHYVFAGFTAHITDAYRLMDVFVLASREEALGSSVLDAFIYGVPVVATQAGGLATLVDGARGLACPVGDAACLAAGMARLLDDVALRERLVMQALAYVQAEHAPDVMARRYLGVYGEGVEAVAS